MDEGDASRGGRSGDAAGLFLCRCGASLGKVVRIDALAEPGRWPGAACVAAHDFLCAPDGQAWLEQRIREHHLSRVVIAACSPREHEETFRRVAERAGLSPWHLQRVNLREQVEWIGGDPEAATARAERLVRAGLARVALHVAIPREEVEASADAVVVGAGPAGVAAALHLAGTRRRVTVVEREHAVGGLANRLDEVFPDLACASCFMEPALDALLHHERIEVLTGAEVVRLRGALGRFELEVAVRPRYVDPEACLGCGQCAEACPASATAADGGARKAIQVPYPGSLPHVSAVDPDLCLRRSGTDCDACAKACVIGAVRLDDAPRSRTLRCGAVIVATGMRPGPVEGPPGVVSTWALERMLHPNGPTGGQVRGASGEAPSAVLLASTADPADPLAAEELLKLAHQLRKKAPGALVAVAGGLGREPSVSERATALAAEGVELLAESWVPGGTEAAGGRLAARMREGATERVLTFDLVAVHGDALPAEGAAALAALLRLPVTARGFLDDGAGPFEPTATRVAGVYVAGAAAGPRPVRRAIRDGVAAAGQVLSALEPGVRLELEPLAAEVDALRCGGCGICISACPYGAAVRDPATGRARVEPVHCRGCGVCAAACPTGAASARHFTRAQVLAEVAALLAAQPAP